MDQALPVPISRHFYKEYSKVNSKLIYVELPRTGHTATSNLDHFLVFTDAPIIYL